jgi:CRP-like cAMP-binding protein
VIVGLASKLAHLRATPPFDRLDDDSLVRVAALADEVAVPAGYVMIYEGEWGDEVFVVADGTAAVIADGRAETTLGVGAVVGATAPLGPPARWTTVVASSPMRFFVFDRDGYAELAAHHPELVA